MEWIAGHSLGGALNSRLIRSWNSAKTGNTTGEAWAERLFTERLARQHLIINLLRNASERPNVSALARRFSVSRKTIQRDLADLAKRGQVDPGQYPDSQ